MFNAEKVKNECVAWIRDFFEKNGKYTTKTRFYVDFISYDKNRNIQGLIIRDHKGNIRFEQLTDEEAKKKNDTFMKLRKLLEENEEKDDSFDRAEFYKYFKVEADSQLNAKQITN